jgi:hypothetical protein
MCLIRIKGNSKSLVGDAFGRLTVIDGPFRIIGKTGKRGTYYKVVCSCVAKTEKLVIKSSLMSGDAISCGCYTKERMSKLGKLNFIHGMKGTSEYWIWAQMLQRCTNKKYHEYYNYGGRGIKVCERWQKFKNFYEDMGLKPSDNHSIERKNNEMGYSLDNCVWATKEVQSRNRRVNHLLEHNGVTKCLRDWCSYFNCHDRAVLYWLHKEKDFSWIYNHFMTKIENKDKL